MGPGSATLRAAVLVLALCHAVAPGAGLLALDVPALAGRVNDLAGLLDDATRQRIEQKLEAFEGESGAQVAVLTLPSLEGESLEDFSIRVVDAWKLGREGVDDGVLLLVARDERQLRLEVGYGLEGTIPDAMARRIVDNVIVPHLQEGDFAGGIEGGVGAVLGLIRGEAMPEVAGEPVGSTIVLVLAALWSAASGCLMPIGIVALFIVMSILQRRYPRIFAQLSSSGGSGSTWSSSSGGSRSSWSSGGGSRSFSGGGGRFGGGGASGRW